MSEITLHASHEDWQLLAALVKWLLKTTDAPVRNGARGAASDFLQVFLALPRLRKNARDRTQTIALPPKTWAWLAYGIYEALESLKDAQAQPDWEALGNEVPAPTGWWLASKLDQAQVWPCYLSLSKSVDLRPWYKPFNPQSPSQELRTTRYWQNRGEIPL
jgi:hypothetical protein